jgi:hypothetical protein
MNLPLDTELIENYTFPEIKIGQSARLLRTLTLQDIAAFAAVSGDTNPAHLDPEYANDTLFHGVIPGHPVSWPWHHLPGPGTALCQTGARGRHPDGHSDGHGHECHGQKPGTRL